MCIRDRWYNALRIMQEFAAELGEDATEYAESADRVRESFARFWDAEAGYCYDVVDGLSLIHISEPTRPY